MIILEVESGNKIEAEIEPVTKEDFKGIKKDKRFIFDWSKEKQHELYKLTIKNSREILGIVSIETVIPQFYLEIRLLEVTKENVGKKKKYDCIAGCLIAFVCRLSFLRGCFGCVCLLPKTELKDYYNMQYGMKFTGLKNYTEGENSRKLIERYLDD